MADAAKRTAQQVRQSKGDMADHNSESVIGIPRSQITFMRSLAGIFAWSWFEARWMIRKKTLFIALASASWNLTCVDRRLRKSERFKVKRSCALYVCLSEKSCPKNLRPLEEPSPLSRGNSSFGRAARPGHSGAAAFEFLRCAASTSSVQTRNVFNM